MKRVTNAEVLNKIGEKVRISGWLNSRRDHGGIVFFDLRDRSGLMQVVCPTALAEGIKEEFVLEIEGEAKKRPANMVNPELLTGEVEIKAEKVRILAKSDALPFDIKDLNVSLPTLLDHRPLTLRNEKVRDIFKIEEEVVHSFRKSLKEDGFSEFQSPFIVPVATEGGAELFPVEYYGRKAFLAQSPQLYKQMMVGIFERVFTVSKSFRAEPSITTRHLSEYVSLDVEMGFIDSWQDLMDACEKILKSIFSAVEKNCSRDLKSFGWEPMKIEKIPRIKMREAQAIIFERVKRDNRKEPDLEPEDEKEICAWAKEKYGSELVFITHYPTKKRPFYTYPDPDDSDYTLSFDLLFKGLEIVTGGQRINDHEMLLENIKKWKNRPEDFSFYLQAFKYGMPQEGGFSFGLERVVKQMLGLNNIREASLFPRDMERIDQRLSILEPKEKEIKTKKKK